MIPSFRSGELLDHYRLNRLVATSGTASVFHATDIRNQRAVAVRIPHSRSASSFFLGYGGPRAKMFGRLDHPGIVRTLAIGRSTPYTVTEWVEGQLLREVMGELSIERSVEIALKICDVLAYIHDCGIVHLDLKPDNILVDARGEIRLIDFDLARKAKFSFLAFFRSRQAGTPDYASPEQIRGRSVSVRSDVYSLGVILYEMLTGEVPFSGVAPPTAVKLRMLSDPLPLREINPEVPCPLEELICRTLSRDPSRRPASIRCLRSDLEKIAESSRECVPSL